MTHLCPRCLRFWTQGTPDRARLLTGAGVRLCPNKADCGAYVQARPDKRRNRK